MDCALMLARAAGAHVLLLLAIVAGVLLLMFWLGQLLALMNMKGDEFPWRYDKALWFVVVFFSGVFGAFVFWLWRRGPQTEARLAREARAMLRGRKQADTQEGE